MDDILYTLAQLSALALNLVYRIDTATPKNQSSTQDQTQDMCNLHRQSQAIQQIDHLEIIHLKSESRSGKYLLGVNQVDQALKVDSLSTIISLVDFLY